jgi:preprotein translocase subunit SecG
MTTFLTVIHVIVCLFLMLTVLLQSGKGGGMGAAFGGGNVGTVFGGSGASQFLRRLTVGAAVVFMMTSMLLAYLASQSSEDALRAFSASQRRQRELKEKLREEAIEGTTPTPDNGAAPDENAPKDEGAPPEGAPDQPAPPAEIPPPTDTPPPAAPKTEPPKTEPPKAGTGDAAKPAATAAPAQPKPATGTAPAQPKPATGTAPAQPKPGPAVPANP